MPPSGCLNAAHVRQPPLDSGLGVLVEVLKTFEIVPCSLEAGTLHAQI